MLRLGLLLLAALLPVSALQAAFRAAVVKVDITPSTPKWLLGYGARQSTGIHDRIYHRIVVMDDGAMAPFVLVSTDLCIFSPTVYDETAAALEQQTGIPRKNFWWTVTHTHSAPEVGPPGIYDVLLPNRSNHPVDVEYTQEVIRLLLDGIKQARAQLAPARLGIGTGMALANINRRAKNFDGKISLGLNPDGPVDRQVGLLRLEKADGTLLALLANYAMHGTVLGGQFVQISGDGPGIVAAYLEEKLSAPVLYLNGAAGNIAPIYSTYPSPAAGHLTQFRVLLGDRILTAAANIKATTDAVQLWSGEKIIESPRRADLGWAKGLDAYERKTPAGESLVRTPVRFLRINDTVLWAAPVEMFCEIAMRVRQDSPFANTFYIGYTNGWLGYLPTAQGFREGGYEPTTSLLTERAETDFVEGVTTFIQSIPRPR